MIKGKIFTILILIICILSSFNTYVQAGSIMDGINDAHAFDEGEQTPILKKSGIHSVLDAAYKLLLMLAIIFSVIYGFVIASKIIVGSIDDKVDAKKMIIEYIKNVVLIALVPTIFGIILEFVRNKS